MFFSQWLLEKENCQNRAMIFVFVGNKMMFFVSVPEWNSLFLSNIVSH